MRLIAAIITTLAMALVVSALIVEPAGAGRPGGAHEGKEDETPKKPKQSNGPKSPEKQKPSEDTQTEQYSRDRSGGRVTCELHASGVSFGQACFEQGAPGDAKSLRERFGGQSLQECRYEEVPPALEPSEAEYDRHEGEDGEFMLEKCLTDVDFDTYAGGSDLSVDVSVVWAENEMPDKHNELSDFLWEQAESGAEQMPVPVLKSHPNPLPVVGAPTVFTFSWVDPADHEPVQQGEYSDREGGGPFKEIDTNGVHMEAEATSVRIDPNQEDMDAIECAADTPYEDEQSADEQPDDACVYTFDRSSASAAELSTGQRPSHVDADEFYVTVEVEWQVRYRDTVSGDSAHTLADGLTMRAHEELPVREIQALNQLPYSIF